MTATSVALESGPQICGSPNAHLGEDIDDRELGPATPDADRPHQGIDLTGSVHHKVFFSDGIYRLTSSQQNRQNGSLLSRR